MSTETCDSYYNYNGQLITSFQCYSYCCGTCTRKYCCFSHIYKLDQSKCKNFDIENNSTSNIMLFMIIFFPIVITICCILVCAGNKLNNRTNSARVGSNGNISLIKDSLFLFVFLIFRK